MIQQTKRTGVKTEFGQRNRYFCDARIAARKGDREKMETAINLMAKIQPISKREQAALDKAKSWA